MRRHPRLLFLLLATALAAMLLPATVASAARPRQATVLPDAYETDDTTTTAKPLPAISYHTITGITDFDWSYVDVAATGTPITVENKWAGGLALSVPSIYSYTPEGAWVQVAMSGPPMGGVMIPQVVMARAPWPGRYYISGQPQPLLGGLGGGRYRHYQAKTQILRVAGANRYATAAEISKKMWPHADASFSDLVAASGGADAISPAGCIIATGKNYADALAAGAWAAKSGMPGEAYPILLTDPLTLSADTAAEIKRLSSPRNSNATTFTVFIVGSSNAVSENVKNQVLALKLNDWTRCVTNVKRLSGPDRAGTAAAIAAYSASSTVGIGDTAFVVNGFSYPEALAAAPIAARGVAPLLLVSASGVPTATKDFLDAHPTITKVVAVGDRSKIATSVLDTLAGTPASREVTRVAGSDKYWTAFEVAKFGVQKYGVLPLSCVLVTGENYPDGLAAAGLTTFQRNPVLLTSPTSLSSAVTSFYATYPDFYCSYMIGGTGTLSKTVESQFNAIRLPMGPG